MAEGNIYGTSKPSVLILGGIGFIGRNLAQYLIENDLVTKVRIVDKVPPQTAWLSKIHQDILSDPRVEFKSGNLINKAAVQNAFICEDGKFDYVVNLAAETKYGQTDPVYKEGIVSLTVNCAIEATRHNVSKYIEVSSGQVYKSSNPTKENGKLDPWTYMARYKLMAEEKLGAIPNLNYVIVRPALVYGIGDKFGITQRLVVGAIYKHLGEMMKLLWTKDLKTNTVHVRDVCKAIWHLFTNGKSGEVYNIVDKGDTTQGKISDIISDIFNINHDYWGTAKSTVAKIDATSLVDEINDLHLAPWSEICHHDGISHTPLNPYIDQEQLSNHNICLDGSKLEATGFTFDHPIITKELMMEIVKDYVDLGIFPASVLS